MLTMRPPLEQNGTWGAKSRKEYILDYHGERIRLPSKISKSGNEILGVWKSRKVYTVDWNDKTNAATWRYACNASLIIGTSNFAIFSKSSSVFALKNVRHNSLPQSAVSRGGSLSNSKKCKQNLSDRDVWQLTSNAQNSE